MCVYARNHAVCVCVSVSVACVCMCSCVFVCVFRFLRVLCGLYACVCMCFSVCMRAAVFLMCVCVPTCACMLLLLYLLVSCVGLLYAFACVSIVCVCVDVIDCLQILVIGLLSSLLESVCTGVMMSLNCPASLPPVLLEVSFHICFNYLISCLCFAVLYYNGVIKSSVVCVVWSSCIMSVPIFIHRFESHTNSWAFSSCISGSISFI